MTGDFSAIKPETLQECIAATEHSIIALQIKERFKKGKKLYYPHLSYGNYMRMIWSNNCFIWMSAN
jgi:hypothetical protein